MIKKNALALLVTFSLSLGVIGQINTNRIEIIPSDEFVKWNQTVSAAEQKHEHQVSDLISVLNGNFSVNMKSRAAQLLGHYRARAAIPALIQNIELDSHQPVIGISLVSKDLMFPVASALENIGSPSISAVIQNLAESDDTKVRELSLKVLYRIEGDKDIVQLRLQKALAAEKDSQKQARLQAALKALAETSFAN